MKSEIAVIFDIDGTIVKNNKCHGKLFGKALNHVYGINAKYGSFSPYGLTDMRIIKEFLKASNVSDYSKISKVAEFMVREYENCPAPEIVEGADKAIQFLSSTFRLAVASGNLKGIGMKKLLRIGISNYFKAFGFSEDGETKQEVLKSVSDKLNSIGVEKLVYVADTPADMVAAKEKQHKNNCTGWNI